MVSTYADLSDISDSSSAFFLEMVSTASDHMHKTTQNHTHDRPVFPDGALAARYRTFKTMSHKDLQERGCSCVQQVARNAMA